MSLHRDAAHRNKMYKPELGMGGQNTFVKKSLTFRKFEKLIFYHCLQTALLYNKEGGGCQSFVPFFPISLHDKKEKNSL